MIFFCCFSCHLHTFLLPDTKSFDQDEMVNSDEKNEELETSPPSDNDTLFNADNQKKEQKQNLKRIILSMIAFSVVSLSTNGYFVLSSIISSRY